MPHSPSSLFGVVVVFLRRAVHVVCSLSHTFSLLWSLSPTLPKTSPPALGWHPVLPPLPCSLAVRCPAAQQTLGLSRRLRVTPVTRRSSRTDATGQASPPRGHQPRGTSPCCNTPETTPWIPRPSSVPDGGNEMCTLSCSGPHSIMLPAERVTPPLPPGCTSALQGATHANPQPARGKPFHFCGFAPPLVLVGCHTFFSRCCAVCAEFVACGGRSVTTI